MLIFRGHKNVKYIYGLHTDLTYLMKMAITDQHNPCLLAKFMAYINNTYLTLVCTVPYLPQVHVQCILRIFVKPKLSEARYVLYLSCLHRAYIPLQG
jgi:hypothetical protein